MKIIDQLNAVSAFHKHINSCIAIQYEFLRENECNDITDDDHIMLSAIELTRDNMWEYDVETFVVQIQSVNSIAIDFDQALFIISHLNSLMRVYEHIADID